MLHLFTRFFKERNLSLTKTTYLLAVSGGVDSVVLCELSKQAGLLFGMVHCNFGLRGEESERDEAFVKELGKKYAAEVFVKRFNTVSYAADKGTSIQEAARELRYAWFEAIRKEHGFAYTLLAHHANDNIETLLLNFFRGSGLDGLTGIPHEKKEVHCLRPMLPFKRKEIEAFAKKNALTWVEDSSNSSNKYTRNFFRNELIPQLQKVFPQVEENLLNNLQRFQQTNRLYKELVQQEKRKLVEVKGEETHIPVLKLTKYKNTSLLYEIIRDFGFGEKMVDEVWKLADAESGKYISNEKWRIIRHRAWLIIAPIAGAAQTYVIDKEEGSVQFDHHRLQLKLVKKEKFSLQRLAQVAQLDGRELTFPLLLRKWKAGDYFYPLGMRKKKKLARFFIDQKLSKTEKEKVWVIESNKKIVWVIGQRIDDRFKISDSTAEIVQLTLSTL